MTIDEEEIQDRLAARRKREIRGEREILWADFLTTDDAKMRVESVVASLDRVTLEALRDNSDGEERFTTYMELLTKGWFEPDGALTDFGGVDRNTKIMRQIFFERCWSIFDDANATFADLAKGLGEQGDERYYQSVGEFVDQSDQSTKIHLTF